MPMTDDYFTTKAARTWAAVAGAEHADLTEISDWARAAHATGKPNVGIVVDQAGQIVAHTVFTTGYTTPRAWYINQCSEVPEVKNDELGLAIGHIKRVTGRPVVHLQYSELCQGRGR